MRLVMMPEPTFEKLVKLLNGATQTLGLQVVDDVHEVLSVMKAAQQIPDEVEAKPVPTRAKKQAVKKATKVTKKRK